MNDHWVLCLVLWCAQLGLLWRPEPQSSEQLDKMLLLDNLFLQGFCVHVLDQLFKFYSSALKLIRYLVSELWLHTTTLLGKLFNANISIRPQMVSSRCFVVSHAK